MASAHLNKLIQKYKISVLVNNTLDLNHTSDAFFYSKQDKDYGIERDTV